MTELDKTAKTITNKQFMNYLFIGLMGFIELIIFCAIIFITVRLIKGPGDELYNLFAMGILLIWFGILVGYYAWAVYFYNINLGLTNEDWDEIREKKRYAPDDVNVPDKNPHSEETFGLPPGTIRGSLALSLMVGGISMTIAGFGMENMVSENAFLVDNFDFFKTAFLMMIAFYFGHKSLELMGYKSQKTYSRNQDTPNDTGNNIPSKIPAPPPPTQNASTAKQILKQGDLSNPQSEGTAKPNQGDNDFDVSGSVQ